MAKEESQLKDLWMLLFDDPKDLDDDQITQLLEAKEELKEAIDRIWRNFPYRLEQIQNYRVRKKELSKLPTEKLIDMQRNISGRRVAYLRSRDDDEIGDSFFEAPPIDSDEHIINELLKERGPTK